MSLLARSLVALDSLRERSALDFLRERSALDSFDSPEQVAAALARLVTTGALALPLPGGGRTAERFLALAEVAATDLSLARLSEGHVDALAILAEACRTPVPNARYGVWAAEPPDARVHASRSPDGWILHGRKRYCSGARGLDRALVTADCEGHSRLFDVALDHPSVHVVGDTWHAVGMAATESLDVELDRVPVAEDRFVGAPGFYLARPGFWQGAIGVAACWYGGALGAYRTLHAQCRRGTPNEHQLAHLGAVAACCETMTTMLLDAADAIDRGLDPDEDARRRRALVVRHVVEQGCQEVLTRVGRAGGTTPLTFDRAHARRAADLVVYLRQHHAERDLAALGREALEIVP